MRIDGKALADTILARLRTDAERLLQHGTTPTLAVILVGDNPASLAYIKQKQKAAERIGARVIFDHRPTALTAGGLHNLIDKYNKDASVHGIIIQRPIPKEVGLVADTLDDVLPAKDVDGFLPSSPFTVPVAVAVGEILKAVFGEQKTVNRNAGNFENDFLAWFRKQRVVVIGRGETAGKPITRYLDRLFLTSPKIVTTPTDFAPTQKRHGESHQCATSQIHSQTPNPELILKKADIIISCVGKGRVVTQDTIKPGSVLISVGIWRDAAGKLRGDYDEEEISGVASHYTPTPGGVGPVNVACLMQNLIKACMIGKGGTV